MNKYLEKIAKLPHGPGSGFYVGKDKNGVLTDTEERARLHEGGHRWVRHPALYALMGGMAANLGYNIHQDLKTGGRHSLLGFHARNLGLVGAALGANYYFVKKPLDRDMQDKHKRQEIVNKYIKSIER